MKKFFAFLLAAAVLSLSAAAAEPGPELSCRAALLMEGSTGTVLCGKNEHQRLAPASVTKIMTMLLVCEALENGSLSLTDTVTASPEAAAMGGSQIWLKEGEQMSVEEMLKCVAVVSANDCSVALAETLCGSEEAFTARMNRRAAELGLEDTHFRNCTGLSGPGEHYSSAYDIALMSAELLRHDVIRRYTTLWMDSIREGSFGLTNTNKLVRHYEGCTGLKTGYTSEAMFCLAASAEREGVEYIAVVLHADSSRDRFAAARSLLDYAFANYTLVSLLPPEPLPPLPVKLGRQAAVQPLCAGGTSLLVEKSRAGGLSWEVELPASVEAPVEEGQELGRLRVSFEGEELAARPLVAETAVAKQSFGQIFSELAGLLFGRK